MAVLFDDGNSEWIKDDSTGLTSYPVSVSCHFNLDTQASAHGLFLITDSATANDWLALLYANDAGTLQAYSKSGGTTSNAVTSSGWSIDTWHVGSASWASTTSRAVYLDGGSKGTNTTSRTPTSQDRLAVGALADSSVDDFVSGKVAEMGVWNVELTDAEHAMLGKFVSPLLVRPGSLVHYWDFVRGVYRDRVGGVTLVNGGNAPDVGTHSPVIMPFGQQLWRPSGAAPPAGVGIRNPFGGPMILRNPLGA